MPAALVTAVIMRWAGLNHRGGSLGGREPVATYNASLTSPIRTGLPDMSVSSQPAGTQPGVPERPRTRSLTVTERNVARRSAEGKTKTEILRCLKRYIAREAYLLLAGAHCSQRRPLITAAR
jgi:hypothetical protein